MGLKSFIRSEPIYRSIGAFSQHQKLRNASTGRIDDLSIIIRVTKRGLEADSSLRSVPWH